MEEECSELRKEVIILRKKCQKLESNIIKGSDAEKVKEAACICEYPHYIKTTSTSTGKICTICAGV